MADSQVLKALLPDNPLCGISTYKETLNLATGACTRQIKKLVLTGEETGWNTRLVNNIYQADILLSELAENRASVSSHYTGFVSEQDNNLFINSLLNTLIIKDNVNAINLTNWKNYLAAQYANGTPVTVWYVLATPEETTISVPSGLSGTEEGYLTQSGRPTPTNPIYPTANEVLIWQHSLRKLTTATDTLITLPADIYADGTNASVGLVGNMQQSGTPTPQNPIQPQGTGERTENLFDKNATNTSNGYADNYRLNSGVPDVAVDNFITEFIEVEPSETYTISGFTAGWSSSVSWYDSNYTLIGYKLYENRSAISFTVPSNAKYIRFTGDMTKKDVTMLNTGSTAKPFEPNGYKIPISSGGVTTNIYLGSTQTTRQIGKIDLSEVSWTLVSIAGQGLWRTLDIPNVKYVSANTELGAGIAEKYTIHTGTGMSTALNCIAIDVSQVSVNTGSNTEAPTGMFWYALATPETATVNEPLMKIGTYADTLSNATAIPTTEGANTITVDTTVQPSEFTATWTGWHDSSVKEWDGSQWNE